MDIRGAKICNVNMTNSEDSAILDLSIIDGRKADGGSDITNYGLFVNNLGGDIEDKGTLYQHHIVADIYWESGIQLKCYGTVLASDTPSAANLQLKGGSNTPFIALHDVWMQSSSNNIVINGSAIGSITIDGGYYATGKEVLASLIDPAASQISIELGYFTADGAHAVECPAGYLYCRGTVTNKDVDITNVDYYDVLFNGMSEWATNTDVSP
jgi:hypothetical protein